MFGCAAFLGLLAVILLSIAAAYGLTALGLHPAMAFLIVAGGYLLMRRALVLVGDTAAEEGQGPATRDRDLARSRSRP